MGEEKSFSGRNSHWGFTQVWFDVCLWSTLLPFEERIKSEVW